MSFASIMSGGRQRKSPERCMVFCRKLQTYVETNPEHETRYWAWVKKHFAEYGKVVSKREHNKQCKCLSTMARYRRSLRSKVASA